MPQEQGYRPTVPDTLITFFKEALAEGDPFKIYYEGDPIIIPQTLLPSMIISEPRTGYETGPTGHDEITHEILIQVVFNKKDDFGRESNEASLERKIDNIMHGRDSVTGDYKPISILGILRKNLTLGNLAIDSIGDVEKGIIARSEELVTQEAHLRLTISELQSVAGRN